MTLSISVLIPKSYLLYNSIHPTFSLGDFNATCITYRNLLVKDTQTGQSPTMLGPVFVHQSKPYEIYNYFASALIGIKQEYLHMAPMVKQHL